MSSGYDVIGDIHGHAAQLEKLLAGTGYAKRDGVWGHPERTAVFVGDLVDRGPENLRACRIAMAMVDAGSALAIMGNHDFNAISLATPDPKTPGAFLRPHSQKNLHQAKTTLEEMERSPQDAAIVLAGLRRLPLWLDLGELRIVHAGWSTRAAAALQPFLDERGALSDEGLVRANRKGDPVREAREVLLNGAEVDLPFGVSYRDADGHIRTSGRLAWWKTGLPGLTWRDVILGDELVRAQLPETPFPADLNETGETAIRPTLFGHYWMIAPLALQTPLHACVDASVAKGGTLAAYRYSGERELTPEHFVYA